MIPSILAFLVVVITLRSFKKSIVFFQMIRKGLIKPTLEEKDIMNTMLNGKKGNWFFSFILMEILAYKVKIFLRTSLKDHKFINRVNYTLKTAQQYPFDREKIYRRLAKILGKYDSVISQRIHKYVSHKPQPVIDLIHNLSKLTKNGYVYMPLTFKAGQESLLSLLGNTYLKFDLKKYRVDHRIVNALSGFFERKDLMTNLAEIAA